MRQDELLCVFSHVRGELSRDKGAMLRNSRRCLREAMPSSAKYDDIAFHEGEVASDVQTRLTSAL